MLLSFEYIFIVISFIWLLIISIFTFRMIAHYNRLVKGSPDKNLKLVLDEILQEKQSTQKDIDFLKRQCDKIEKEGLYHIQKIGLLRFNPFKDTGGDQSFILALIDGKDTGIVISGLYSRSGTRWYAKKVLEGKGTEHELSDEEKKAIKEAKHTKEYE